MESGLRKTADPEKRRLNRGWDRELHRLRVIKTVFTISLVALVGVTALALWLVLTDYPVPPRLESPELWSSEEIMVVQQTGGRLLGRHIQDFHSLSSILVLVPPSSKKDNIDTATLQGLMEGLSGHHGTVMIQEVELIRDGGLTEAHLWFDAESFDIAVAPFSEFQVIVSIMGLPFNPGEMVFWQRRPRPQLMLINAEIFRLSQLIKGVGITAVATRNPGYDFSPDPDFVLGAEELWIIITPDNIEELQAKHENLFVPEDEIVELDELDGVWLAEDGLLN